MDKSQHKFDDKDYLCNNRALNPKNSKETITACAATSEDNDVDYRKSVPLIDYSLQNITFDERSSRSPSVVSIDHGRQHNLSRKSMQKKNMPHNQKKRSPSSSSSNCDKDKSKQEHVKGNDKHKSPNQNKEYCWYTNEELQKHHEKAELHRQMRFQHKQLLQQQELQIKQQRILQKEQEKLAKLQQFQMKQLEQLKMRHEQEKERYVHRSRQQLFKEIQKDVSPQTYSCSSENELLQKEKQHCKKDQKDESPQVSRSCPNENEQKIHRKKCCGDKSTPGNYSFSPNHKEKSKLNAIKEKCTQSDQKPWQTGNHLPFHDLDDDENEPIEQGCSQKATVNNKKECESNLNKCRSTGRSRLQNHSNHQTHQTHQRSQQHHHRELPHSCSGLEREKTSCYENEISSDKKHSQSVDLRELNHQLNGNCSKGKNAIPLLANAVLPNSKEEYEYLNRLCYVRSLFEVLDRIFIDYPSNTEEEPEETSCSKESGKHTSNVHKPQKRTEKKRKVANKSKLLEKNSYDEKMLLKEEKIMGAYRSCGIEPDPTLSDLEKFQTHCLAYSTIHPVNMRESDLFLVCNVSKNSSQTEYSNENYCADPFCSNDEVCMPSSEPYDCETVEEEGAYCDDFKFESELSDCEDNEDYNNISFAEFIKCPQKTCDSGDGYGTSSPTHVPRRRSTVGQNESHISQKNKQCAHFNAEEDNAQTGSYRNSSKLEGRKISCKIVDKNSFGQSRDASCHQHQRSSLKSSHCDKKANSNKICINMPQLDANDDMPPTNELVQKHNCRNSGGYNVEDPFNLRNEQYPIYPTRRARSRTPQPANKNDLYHTQMTSARKRVNQLRPFLSRLRGSGVGTNADYLKPGTNLLNTASSEYEQKKVGVRNEKCSQFEKDKGVCSKDYNHPICNNETCKQKPHDIAKESHAKSRSNHPSGKYSDLDKFEQSSPKRSNSNETHQGRENREKDETQGCCPKKRNQKMSKEKKQKSRNKHPTEIETESEPSSLQANRRDKNNKKKSKNTAYSSDKYDKNKSEPKEFKSNKHEPKEENLEKSNDDQKNHGFKEEESKKNDNVLDKNLDNHVDNSSDKRIIGKRTEFSKNKESGPQYVVGSKTCCWEESRIDWLTSLENGNNMDTYRNEAKIPADCKDAKECWNKMQEINVETAESKYKYPPIYYCPNSCSRDLPEVSPSLNCCSALKMWFAHMFGCRIV